MANFTPEEKFSPDGGERQSSIEETIRSLGLTGEEAEAARQILEQLDQLQIPPDPATIRAILLHAALKKNGSLSERIQGK
ncbi:hypothetical protein [Thermoflavifilum thermophilum]|uniref:Uncharacterized protein n=1 Tax=Thermoflavifilum thermophilum TaxID=1393122 RepID=A0A1I7N657_9BACT|nr:hypothetical protein [Thermoflavifilum thermophilum]SFV30142.1 hypothetical protein SAMN05660895_0708 [Thermoflavifilum thermophilum]